ncbi:MAG: PKD domain-containing protein [Bacteroidota bacterium]
MRNLLCSIMCWSAILLIPQNLSAQYLATVGGEVLDAMGDPVFNQLVVINGNSTSTGNPIYVDSVYTNPSGFYVSNGFLASNDSMNVSVTTTDCQANGLQILLRQGLITPSDTSFQADFDWCEDACEALFAYQKSGFSTDFTSLSSSPYGITSYNWSFGDGTNSNLENPTHVYQSSARYPVCLTITDSSNCFTTYCDTVEIEDCLATFNWVNQAPLQINFFANNVNIANPVYEWDFGDGRTGMNQVTTHTYNAAGTYQVILFVTDSVSNCTAIDSQFVTVIDDDQCQADFSAVTIGAATQFQNLSSHSLAGGGNITYQWAFGDGNTSIQEDPQHFYGASGVYLVCLLMVDDFGCRDTVCKLVDVDLPLDCSSDFVFNQINNLTVAFSALDLQDELTYRWEVEGIQYSTQNALFHTFPSPGDFEVCLWVSDTLKTCLDSTCQTVTLNANDLCVADFAWNYLGNGEFIFYNLSMLLDPSAYQVDWDFGDGQSSSDLNPRHTYAGSGPYTVCLFIQETNSGCFQETCYEVVLDSNPNSLYSIQGWVYEATIPTFNSQTFLYKDDPAQSRVERLENRPFIFEPYKFRDLDRGTYLIYNRHTGNQNLIPTYLGDVIHWQDATSTVLNDANVVNPPISMIEGINIQGPGQIRGGLFEGLGQATGPAMEDEVILLLADNVERTPIGYDLTAANGSYRFDNLAFGTYWLQPEIPGIYASPIKVVISPTNILEEEVDFGVGNQFAFPTSNETYPAEGITVFPNPADEQIRIEVDHPFGVKGVKITDMLGRICWQQEGAMVGDLMVYTGEWPVGVYSLVMETQQGKKTQQLMITH